MIGFVFSIYIYLKLELDYFIGLVDVPSSLTQWIDIEFYLFKISPKAILLNRAETI